MFMWVNHIFLRDQLRDELASSLPFLLKLFTTLWGGGVNTENKFVFLISLGEGIQSFFRFVEVSSISEPGWLGDLVVEQTGRVTLTELFKSEPVEDVWLHSLTEELHGSPFTVHIMHCVIPSLA